jgi:polyhydroxyalkanoate synthesis regulator phasin
MMIPQNIPSKKSFKLDDLSRELGVKKFIIKSWEKQFDCKKFGSDGRYTQEDYKVFAIIKDLVFNKKLSHSAAKKQLQDVLEGKMPEQPSFDAAKETEIPQIENQQEPNELTVTCSEETTEIKPAFKEKEEFFRTIKSLKEQLLKIHEQLK